MNEPITLVPRTEQAREDVHKSVIEALEETLKQARDGDIRTVCILVEHSNGNWSVPHSGSMDMCRAIGRLEMFKQSWIRKYLDEG